MPKVAFVAHWDWVLFNFRLPLARALRKQGCEVVFLCPYGQYVTEFKALEFPYIEWRLNRRSLNPVKELYAISRLATIYREVRPDLVHHFTIKPNLYGSLAAKLTGVPSVINTVTGLGFVFSGDQRARILFAALRPLMSWALRGQNIWTVFQNESDYKTLTRYKLVVACRTRLIRGSGVNVERFSPCNKTKPSIFVDSPTSDPIVIMASRLLWEKGVAEFVEAARLLKHKGISCRFWLAGEPDIGNPRSISEDQLSAWREEGVVEFLGHRSDMPDLMRQATIAVLPSYSEGMPRFLLEAASAGLPLVASHILGCQMVVREGVNGYLIPPQDAVALAKALEYLLQDESLRSRFGEASRRIALEEFNEEKVIGDYLALYRHLGVIMSKK